MIILTKGDIKDLLFTGSESALLTSPYFLFVFTNRVTQEIVKFVATNSSTTLRYDKFTFEVNDYFISILDFVKYLVILFCRDQ